MEQEKRVQISVRLPESLARKFKAACALKGISIQDYLEQVARELVDKEKPE
jgi:predicted DNA binding CopG/RHH family protein